MEHGHSGFSTYNPMQTLEQQYAAPVGSRYHLIVKANPNCCYKGGVEALLKQLKKQALSSSSNKDTNAEVAKLMRMDSSSSEVASGTDGTVPTTGSSTTTTTADNPFAFLGSSSSSSLTSDGALAPESSSSNKKTNKLGQMFSNITKKATASIESGMQHMAIKSAETLGRQKDIKDQMVIGLYYSSWNGHPNSNAEFEQPQQEQLWSMTEPQAIPEEDAERLQGVSFIIPLVVPPGTEPNVPFTIKVWMRSGATPLFGTKAKHYLLGRANVTLGQLLRGSSALQQPPQQQPMEKNVKNVPLQSTIIVDGQVQVTVVPDPKQARDGQPGWSLTDPALTGYTTPSGNNTLYHWPLDQSYAYTTMSSSSSLSNQQNAVLATERATESTIVLPLAAAFAQWASSAANVSLQHAHQVLTEQLLHYRYDAPPLSITTTTTTTTPSRDVILQNSKATASIGLGYMLLIQGSPLPVNQQVYVSIAWQRPDSIFEVELVKPTAVKMHTTAVQYTPVLDQAFYPKLTAIASALPNIQARYQQQQGQQPPPPFLMGNLRITVLVPTARTASAANANPFDQIAPSSQSIQAEMEEWQGIFALEPYMFKNHGTTPETLQVPVYDVATKAPQGSVVLQLSIQLPPSPMATPPDLPSTTTTTTPAAISPSRGLVSLMGLDTLMETSGALPAVDYDPMTVPHTNSPDVQRRRAQLVTMGLFMTHPYLAQHISQVRELDTMSFQHKAEEYTKALNGNGGAAAAATVADGSVEGEPLPAHEDRTPKAFRPSSSRPTPLLAGLPFNVHIASLGLMQLPSGTGVSMFHNITCGAPSDHARGFGSLYAGGGAPSGGLRRLEAKRLELQQHVANAQTHLIMGVTNYFVLARQTNPNVYHVPATNHEITNLRWKVFDMIQKLHLVTWQCAMRRSHCFSQALAIALSSLLTSLSDANKVRAGWADLWVQHGYLISYEGLLSAAGKELGMIEDASVGIAMLRMCTVQMVPDTPGNASAPAGAKRVVVPHSPYLRWLQIMAIGTTVGSQTQYQVTIGVEPTYFATRIPEPVRGGTIRLYPLLFQVGVDIRQWGANTGKKASSQIKDNVASVVSTVKGAGGGNNTPTSGGGGGGGADNNNNSNHNDDDYEDEDTKGMEDEDVLIALNYEALRKMNAYAHVISPIPAGSPMTPQQIKGSTDQDLPVHPVLTSLHAHIVGSAGKMNHGILDEASQVAQKLGGGGAIFCKSGKDRTAMHVTFKQAQYTFTAGLRGKQPDPADTIYQDATRMRVYGTRLPICEKNVGQAKYAFNTLQVRFMPDMLKPPINTLAGFLKGGDIFKKGGIES